VIGKAEYLAKGANPRFVVTSLSAATIEGRTLYEQVYCARGEMENRIKEQQLDLFADRTSAATMRANQLRLWFASFAYVLLEALRRIGLRHTQFQDATCGTIRLNCSSSAPGSRSRCGGSRWRSPRPVSRRRRPRPSAARDLDRTAASPRRGLSRSTAPVTPLAFAALKHACTPRHPALATCPASGWSPAAQDTAAHPAPEPDRGTHGAPAPPSCTYP
jgi:Transposase DDE domain group 1